jgi:hypothetical protein
VVKDCICRCWQTGGKRVYVDVDIQVVNDYM